MILAGPSPWVPIGISSSALLISVLALLVTYANYRASGSRVRVTEHSLVSRDEEHWLRVRVVNAGRAEVDVEGVWAERFGATSTSLPQRLPGGSSLVLLFRSEPSPAPSAAALTLRVRLGDGRELLNRLKLSETEQGVIGASWLREVLADGKAVPAESKEASDVSAPSPNTTHHSWVDEGPATAPGPAARSGSATFSFHIEELADLEDEDVW